MILEEERGLHGVVDHVSPLNSVISALLIAIILLIVGLREGIRGCRADFLIRESQSV